jgi:iron complex outermembrane recepter protein
MKQFKRTNIRLYRGRLYGCVSITAILTIQNPAYAQQATAPIPDVSVSAAPTGPLMDGSAAAGYRVKDSTAAGPIWSDLPLQDTPYSTSVVPSALIENLQAYSIDDLAKVIPQVTNVYPLQNVNGNSFLYLRGFSVVQFTNNGGVTYNGMQGGAGGMFYTPLEDKERVEVLSGVDGFLYGTGSVGGNVNYVLKRPTDTQYSAVTIGDNAGANGFIHADLGGPLAFAGIQDGLLGYRLNIVGQDGDTSIQNQSVKRNLVSAAIDIHLPYDILLQLNAAHSNYHIYGTTPEYTSTLSPYPAPTNPANLISNPFLQFSDETDTGGLNLTWKINDIFTIRTAYDYTDEARPTILYLYNTIKSYSGLTTLDFLGGSRPATWYTNSGYSFLDTKLSLFGIENKLTTGFTGFYQTTNIGAGTSSYASSAQTFNFYSQVPIAEPNLTETPSSGYISKRMFAKNYVIGDEIKFNDHFTILAGGNYTTLGIDGFNSMGGSTGADEKGAITPSVSLIYKILPWLTTYATYQQSLQGGEQVLNSASAVYTNNGQILPPYIGDQYEVGVKATVATNLLVTAALFDVTKANQYQQINPDGTSTEIQSGREVHKGGELTASGKVWDDLTIIGGVTMMDARVTNDPANTAFNGSIPAGVSPMSEKIYAEYTVPVIPEATWLHGLTLIGGFHWSSAYYINQPNTTKLPGYAVEDLGFRYTTTLYDKPFILRFNVNNVLNTAYWIQSTFEGAPRTFLASAEMKF